MNELQIEELLELRARQNSGEVLEADDLAKLAELEALEAELKDKKNKKRSKHIEPELVTSMLEVISCDLAEAQEARARASSDRYEWDLDADRVFVDKLVVALVGQEDEIVISLPEFVGLALEESGFTSVEDLVGKAFRARFETRLAGITGYDVDGDWEKHEFDSFSMRWMFEVSLERFEKKHERALAKLDAVGSLESRIGALSRQISLAKDLEVRDALVEALSKIS